MKSRSALLYLFPLLFLFTAQARGDRAKVEWKPLSVGGLQEIGQLQKGIWKDINEPFRDEWVDHFGAFFTQEALVEDRLRIAVGLVGIFQFPKPEVAQSEFGGSQYKAFFIGPTIAEGVYLFGDPGNPAFELGMGMFPFKYHAAAGNLGEYLFRSGPYPTYMTTGGFSITNNAAAYLQGLKARWKAGGLVVDGLFVTETSMPPLYDWSLAFLAAFNTGGATGGGFLEIGAGVNFKRLLQVRPSKTTPRNLANAYFERGGAWYPGSPEEHTGRAGFHGGRTASGVAAAKDRLIAVDPAHPALAFLENPTASNLDSAYRLASNVPGALPALSEARGNRLQADGFTALADSIKYWTTTDSVVDPVSGLNTPYAKPALRYFSSEGVLLMGRATVDLKKVLPSGLLGPDDLKVFAEAALLGWKDYPLYYTDRARRMPVMVGMNLPAFKLLDLVSVQVEHFDSPYANNFLSLGSGKATPFFPEGTNPEYSEKSYYDAATRDDWSWSVLLRKQVLPGLDIHAQFARDHLRTVGTDWFFGSRLEPNEIIHLSRNWYWTFMVSWGL